MIYFKKTEFWHRTGSILSDGGEQNDATVDQP